MTGSPADHAAGVGAGQGRAPQTVRPAASRRRAAALAVRPARHVDNGVIGPGEKGGDDADSPRVILEGSHARF